MTKPIHTALCFVLLQAGVQAFAPTVRPSTLPNTAWGVAGREGVCTLSMSDAQTEDSVFVPEDADALEKAEKLGRGSAKAKRGKRKSGAAAPDAAFKASASLTPEDVFYEGPPAITETIIPTISILSVVGIIPAAAAWARQAWVRYKITTRRIRVTSGIAGKDMAEIVYPDIVEMRSVKRLFGDGDVVFFLRDGAKFEMRNIPNFQESIAFILDNVDKDVASEYRAKGDVTTPTE